MPPILCGSERRYDSATSRFSAAPARRAPEPKRRRVVRPILASRPKRGDAASSSTRVGSMAHGRIRPRTAISNWRAAARRLSAEFAPRSRLAAANIRALRRVPDAARKAADLAPRRARARSCGPLDTVAAYIPAGRYPLPSTIMMTAVPALVAGVTNVCVACSQAVGRRGAGDRRAPRGEPRLPDGRRAGDRRLCARHRDRAPRRPHRGPGNVYVAAAKKLLAGEVGHRFRRRSHRDSDLAADGEPRHPRRRHAGAGRARRGRLAPFCLTTSRTWPPLCRRGQSAARRPAHRRRGSQSRSTATAPSS